MPTTPENQPNSGMVQQGIRRMPIPIIEADQTIVQVNPVKTLRKKLHLPSLQTVKRVAIPVTVAAGIATGGIATAYEGQNLWNAHLQADKTAQVKALQAQEQALQAQKLYERTHVVLPAGKNTIVSAKGWSMSYTTIGNPNNTQSLTHSPLNFSIDSISDSSSSHDIEVPKDNPSWWDQHFGSSKSPTDIKISFYDNSQGQKVPEVTVTQYEGTNKHSPVKDTRLLQQDNNAIFQLQDSRHTFYFEMKRNQFAPTEYDFQGVDYFQPAP